MPFPPHPLCVLCPRSRSGCAHPGIATERLDSSLPPAPSTPAIVFVAAFPSTHEDAAARPLVGPAGSLLRRLYIAACSFGERGTIYLTNALRCHVPGDPAPKASSLSACRPHLIADLVAISASCAPAPLHLVLLGAPACRQMGFRSLAAAQRSNGQRVTLPEAPAVGPVWLYATYNPAVLTPYRKSGDSSKATLAKARSVALHLSLLEDRLSGVLPPSAQPAIVSPVLPTLDDPRLISIDIETFGAVAATPSGRPLPPQTHFHPAHHPEIGVSDLVATCAITVPASPCSATDPSGWSSLAPSRSFVLRPHLPGDRRVLGAWLAHATHLLGHNIAFDITWLRRLFPAHLRGRHTLVDTSVYRYLWHESADELSLKDLGPLFGLFDYTTEDTLAEGHRFRDANDPLLALYNARDTHRTILLLARLCDAIATAYPGSPKLSARTLRHYSDLLWLAVRMSDAGVRFDVATLRSHLARLTTVTTALRRRLRKRYGVLVNGPGSSTPANPRSLPFFVDAAFARSAPALLNDRRLAYTKTGYISTAKGNRRLFLAEADPTTPDYHVMSLIGLYKTSSKLIDSYYTPLLRDYPHAGPAVETHPTWFVTPGRPNDDRGGAGGTEQCRITCRGPAIQTFPASIKDAIAPSRPGGSVEWFDLSQIELRVAAVLSGEPVMLAVYADPLRNLHLETARLLYGPNVQKNTVEYKSGKESNFLITYRGGPSTLRLRILMRTGVSIPIAECRRIINAVRADRPVLWAWQDSLIDEAARAHYLILKPYGQSRYFPGSRATVFSSFVNAICNFPIQSHAANVLLDIQKHLTALLVRSPITQIANVYDAVALDCPPHHATTARTLFTAAVDRCATRGYWAHLCADSGHHVPLTFD